MNNNVFKYKLDRRARLTTWITLGVIILVFGALWFFTRGDYLPAWFISIAVAAMGLIVLSIPRSIRVTSVALEIRCVVEITHIPYEHIASVRRIERTDLPRLYPVFASCGFFGWFGYWLDARGWDIIKVYASSWQDLVMIEDIYEQRYLVNADTPDALLDAIGSKMGSEQ